jgi:hypothetical protein
MGDGMFHLHNYFQRFDTAPPHIKEGPSSDLRFVIVIPAYAEPDLLTTLESLYHCTPPKSHGEVIVHINHHRGAPGSVKKQNRESFKVVKEWIKANDHPQLDFHVIFSDQLPEKDAGPGVARKIGMDEALHRFREIGRLRGTILSLDADCTVEPDYLVTLDQQFVRQSKWNGCNIYFEHPLVDDQPKSVTEGIVNYELFLRYYRQALRYIEFPYPYHTIGSCMGVKADVYAKQGGMNKNKGGEDFYFLHKIFPLGQFIEINDTAVYPQARLSQRVPYGTGMAITEWVEKDDKQFYTYPLQQFKDLRLLFEEITELYALDNEQLNTFVRKQNPAVSAFLQNESFVNHITEIQQNTAELDSFEKRFFDWFNGMKVLKYCDFGKEHEYYPPQLLRECSSNLLYDFFGVTGMSDASLLDLLDKYRAIDKSQPVLSESV